MRIAFVTTCKGRTHHLRQTLPRNLAANPAGLFVILNYNSDDGLLDYVRSEHDKEIGAGRLILYSHYDAPVFHMAHAKNMAHRCAMHEGADILVTLDADNYTGLGFDAYIANKFGSDRALAYICPDFAALPRVGHRFNKDNPERLGRGFAGRLAIRSQDFVKLGGYNETYDTWRGEDIDLLARADRLGIKSGNIDEAYLNAINHSSGVRFREYPHAQQFENNDVYVQTKNATDSVVNYGRIGCGTAFRGSETAPVTLGPLPTRVFGIGFQRTGTSSLHAAFRLLGFDSAHWESGDWAFAIWREMHRWGRSFTLERHYALCDNPIPLLYEKLDAAYPGSKFILTVRNERDWVESVKRLWSYEHNPRRWTWDIDRFSHRVHAITYGRADFEPDVFLARYRRHNAEVREYFRHRSDDLLVMDISQGAGWPELCGFLRQLRPSEPFPHEHALRK